MKQDMYEHMYQTDRQHWWFRAKREIVMALIASRLSSSQENKTIDFGCGCGMMLEVLSSYGEVTGADVSQTALDYCKKRFSGELRLMDLSAPCTPWAAYDLGIALDLLEHVDRDATAAQNLLSFLRPGGLCIITVPAYQALWSSHGVNCMHKRRYALKNLRALLRPACSDVAYLSYYNSLLFPLAAPIRIFSKFLPFDQASSMENTCPAPVLNAILYHIFSLEQKRICQGKTYPFGLSLIALARRPG